MRNRWTAWLDRHFQYDAFDGSLAKAAIVNHRLYLPSAPICPSLHRWTLLDGRWGRLVLHCWEADDWSRDLHDHSARIVSLGLRGTYTDVTATGERRYRAPFLRTFPASHTHRIKVVTGPVWTLVYIAPKSHASAFLVNGRRVAASQYVVSARARRMKAC